MQPDMVLARERCNTLTCSLTFRLSTSTTLFYKNKESCVRQFTICLREWSAVKMAQK